MLCLYCFTIEQSAELQSAAIVLALAIAMSTVSPDTPRPDELSAANRTSSSPNTFLVVRNAASATASAAAATQQLNNAPGMKES